MTYREVIYIIMDLSKGLNDDTVISEEHIKFLVDKYRAALLAQKYKTVKLEVAESNYQMLCADLEEIPAIDGLPCEGHHYLRTTKALPKTMSIGNTIVYPVDFYQGMHITFISRERMRYVGYNELLRNIIYCSLNPDGKLYFKSNNPQFIYLERIKVSAVFEEASEASELSCDEECDPMDRRFPLEEALLPQLVDAVLKEVVGASWRPADSRNNANDDLSDLATYIARNAKSNLQKQIEA